MGMARVAALALLVASCSGGAGSSDADTDDSAGPDELALFYELMQDNALGFGFEDGDWTEDMGDAPFYGLGFYARASGTYERDDYRSIADQARGYNLTVIRTAAGDFSYFVDNLEEVIMSALGLIEYAHETGDTSFIEDLDTIVDNANDALALYGDYLEGTGLDSWAIETYGPTAITGAVALLDLQYATYMTTDRRQDRIDRAAEIVAAIDANAWDGTRYLFRPSVTRLYLYPNMMMILVLVRTHELTGFAEPLARAETIFESIQPLKNATRGGYNSPYSAELMGATTQDYSTLSSQNYLAMGLVILHENTADETYLAEALDILDFIRLRLYSGDEHAILHHWMDGRVAQPADPEYFCSGCNLQFLYVVWYLLER